MLPVVIWEICSVYHSCEHLVHVVDTRRYNLNDDDDDGNGHGHGHNHSHCHGHGHSDSDSDGNSEGDSDNDDGDNDDRDYVPLQKYPPSHYCFTNISWLGIIGARI